MGPDGQAISRPMLFLGYTLLSQHRFKDAEQLALKTLCIREKAFGEDSLPVGKSTVLKIQICFKCVPRHVSCML